MSQSLQVCVAGGGIAGLSTALALNRQMGLVPVVLERAPVYSEIGAGIQLGPNATRWLIDWGLEDPLREVVGQPEALHVWSADSGDALGKLGLGRRMRERYGFPYYTVHRADLHHLLLEACRTHGVELRNHAEVEQVNGLNHESPEVCVRTNIGDEITAHALIAADGVWSKLRSLVVDDGMPVPTGHVAYRALVRQSDLPVHLRVSDVHVWMGQGMHVVHYPVRAADEANMVVLIEGPSSGPLHDWRRPVESLRSHVAITQACTRLRDWVAAIESAAGGWKQWTLAGRSPVAGAHQMAQGRLALAGDAAHPMLPYLAQGAGMAIEDAATLSRRLQGVSAVGSEVERALQQYAQQRWQRCAQVQARAVRNGHIFHMPASTSWARNLAIRVMGESLLDVPWLYKGINP
ncbi:MAG: hypothetical protein RLZZ397_862 [Pseudomonadota bacterium]|jgi:salicylate hydroxylase